MNNSKSRSCLDHRGKWLPCTRSGICLILSGHGSFHASNSPSVASNSQATPTAGLPLDIAAILDMVTISGQQPQHTLPVGQSAEGVVSQKAASEDAGSSSATEPTQAAAADANAESSDSSSSDWDSSSDSEDEEQSRQPSRPSQPSKLANSDDEDEDLGGKTTSGPLKTTNEVVDPDVAPPSIERVGDDEILEIVGEVMSVIGSVVVVKGQPGSAVEKVLDTGSLLVWDDRHVLGEVRTVFGLLRPQSNVFIIGF